MATVAEVGALIVARLQTITNLTVFDGKVGTVVKDGNIARPYAVLYMSPGMFDARRGGRAARYGVSGQVTVAAGSVAGFRWAVGQVLNTLADHRLEPSAPAGSLFTFDADPGPERRDDDDPSDIRWYVPLPFTYFTTRS